MLSPTQENMQILFEIYKLMGITFNVVIAYEVFKAVHKQQQTHEEWQKMKEEQLRNMFLVALQNLKYMGFLSATRQSTFAFRKNFFGKPSKDVGALVQNARDEIKESKQMGMILDVMELAKK